MSGFRTSYPVRFRDCDPAGIAYFPRLLELADLAVEDWTAAVLPVGRPAMHLQLRMGLPTVELSASFTRPCRLGEELDALVTVRAVGRTSIDLELVFSAAGEPRFSARSRQVLMDLEFGKSAPWPTEWRQALAALQ